MSKPSEELAPLPPPGPPALLPPGLGLSALPPEEPSLLWRVTARYARVLLACAAVSLALAWVGGTLFAKSLWQAEAELLYQPVTLTDQQRIAYQPPNLLTLTGWLREPKLLEAVIADSGLNVTPWAFAEKYLKVEQPVGTESVLVTVKWTDRETAIAVLNRLIERYLEYLVVTRKGAILRRSHQATQQSLAQALSEVQRFDRQIRELEGQLARDGFLPDGGDFDGSMVVLRSELNDRSRQAQHRLTQLQFDLTKLKLEYEKYLKLALKGAHPWSEVESQQHAVASTELQIKHTKEDLEQLQKQLRTLPIAVAKSKREMERQKVVYFQDQVRQIEADLKYVNQPGGPPARGALEGMNAREFAIRSAAQTGDRPESSNRKTVIALAFLALMGVAFGLAVVHDRRHPPTAGAPAPAGPVRTRVVEVADRGGGKVTIAQVDSDRLSVRLHQWVKPDGAAANGPPPVTIGPDGQVEAARADDDEARHMALRIQQWLERGANGGKSSFS